MNRIICDLCGQELLKASKVRYEVKIEVKAAYDPLNITDEGLHQDFQAEFAKVLAQLRRGFAPGFPSGVCQGACATGGTLNRRSPGSGLSAV